MIENKIKATLFIFFILFFLLSNQLYAIDLGFVGEQKKSTCHYTLTLAAAKQLAGVKITLAYPKNLEYTIAKKGPLFDSFFHIVNDKYPGELSLVMASARGVSGVNISLLSLEFQDSSKGRSETCTNIVMRDCHLMNNSLMEIPCDQLRIQGRTSLSKF